jgi:hypothetical protein
MSSIGLNYRRDGPNRGTEESPDGCPFDYGKKDLWQGLRLAIGAFQNGDQQLKACKLIARRIRLSFYQLCNRPSL